VTLNWRTTMLGWLRRKFQKKADATAPLPPATGPRLYSPTRDDLAPSSSPFGWPSPADLDIGTYRLDDPTPSSPPPPPPPSYDSGAGDFSSGGYGGGCDSGGSSFDSGGSSGGDF
jgi:hypothetical protein